MIWYNVIECDVSDPCVYRPQPGVVGGIEKKAKADNRNNSRLAAGRCEKKEQSKQRICVGHLVISYVQVNKGWTLQRMLSLLQLLNTPLFIHLVFT